MRAALILGRLIPVAVIGLFMVTTGWTQVLVPVDAPKLQKAVDEALAPAPDYQWLVDEAVAKYKDDTSGANASYIKILTETPSNLFGVVIVTRDGKIFKAGDVDYKFSIQSVSKPFTAALIMSQQSPEVLKEKVGVEPTGMAFNSKLALAIYEKAVNPMVNAGAIGSVSLVKADTEKERWDLILQNLSDFAGENLEVLEEVFESEYGDCEGNRGIAHLLRNWGKLYCDPEEAVKVYTRQCAVGVSAVDLGMMGATLANGGVNPKTGKRVMKSEDVPELLAVMATAGFYDESGEWMYTAGLPAKTGVGGGIVAVVPGKMAIAAFSPRLNEAGNSIRASQAIGHISKTLEANVFGTGK
jgi:glutaminase